MIWHQISHFKPAERATGFFWHSRRLPGTKIKILLLAIIVCIPNCSINILFMCLNLLYLPALWEANALMFIPTQCPYPISTSYPNIISEMNIQLSMSQLFPVYRPVYSESSFYIKNNCAFVFLSMLPLRNKFPTKCYWDQVSLDHLLRKTLRGIVPLQKNGLVWTFRGKTNWWLSKPFSWLNCHHIQ